MAEPKRYVIKVQGTLVEVSKEVYRNYYGIERHTRTLDEKDERNGKVLYSALDNDETLGEEMIPDYDAVSTEDMVETKIMCAELRKCLCLLTEQEQELIQALYYKKMNEREYAEIIGLSQKGVNKRRHKIIEKLRSLMKI